jgi:hypothetical protein
MEYKAECAQCNRMSYHVLGSLQLLNDRQNPGEFLDKVTQHLKFDSEAYSPGRVLRGYARLKFDSETMLVSLLTHLDEFSAVMPV